MKHCPLRSHHAWVALACALALALGWWNTGASLARAQSPAGGPPDIMARLIGQKLTEAWGQQVVVDSRATGRSPEAEEALRLNREIGNKRGIAIGLTDLARVARYQGKGERSRELLNESLPLLQQLGDKPEIASCLIGFVADWIEREDSHHAAVLLGVIDGLLEAIGSSLDQINRAEYDRASEALLHALGDATLQAARQQGRKLSLEQALALASANQYEPVAR